MEKDLEKDQHTALCGKRDISEKHERHKKKHLITLIHSDLFLFMVCFPFIETRGLFKNPSEISKGLFIKK